MGAPCKGHHGWTAAYQPGGSRALCFSGALASPLKLKYGPIVCCSALCLHHFGAKTGDTMVINQRSVAFSALWPPWLSGQCGLTGSLLRELGLVCAFKVKGSLLLEESSCSSLILWQSLKAASFKCYLFFKPWHFIFLYPVCLELV